MKRIKPIAFIGPSGSGKSTLANLLIERHPSLTLVRSHTTRPKRSTDDTSHHFVDDTEFDKLLQERAFIGTLDIFGYRYGLTELPSDATPLLLLRVPAVPKLRELYPDSLVIEIDAPLATLQERLEKRGSHERIDQKQLEREAEAGRSIADVIVETNQTISNCLRDIEKALELNDV